MMALAMATKGVIIDQCGPCIQKFPPTGGGPSTRYNEIVKEKIVKIKVSPPAIPDELTKVINYKQKPVSITVTAVREKVGNELYKEIV